MGSPQAFTGTSGAVQSEPQAPAPGPAPLALRVSPRPAPVAPSEPPEAGGPVLPDFKPADLPPGVSPSVPMGFRPPMPPPRPADTPAADAVPVAGTMPAPAAAPAAASGSDGGFDFGGALKRFTDRGGSGLLVGLGTGLMSTPGFGNGLAAGFQNAQKAEQQRAVTGLAQAELGIKQRKLAQETAALSGNASVIKRAFPNLSDAEAVSAGSNSGQVTEALKILRDPNHGTGVPAGYRQRPDGQGYEPIPGSEADPNVIRTRAQAQTEGATAGKPAEPFNLSPGQKRYDADGKLIAEAGSQKPDGFDVETKLRGEFAKGLGTFTDVHDGYGRVIAATKLRETDPAKVSPASDMSLVFGFMKMLDPTSVVREGEYATAKNAAGIPDQIRNAYNKAKNGEFLTPDQRKDILGQATELYGTARKNADTIAGRYRNLAGQYGVDPERAAFLPPAPEAPRVRPARSPSPASGPLDVGASRDAGGGVTIRRVR